MAKQQFDRQDVLNNATSLFWRVGYSATSMQAVFEATGLKPGSVYLAFGNKEGLFKESLAFYAQNSIAKLTDMFNQNDSVHQVICDVLHSFVEEATQANYCGCFLLKSQLELADNADIKNYVSEQLKIVEDIYATQLAQLYCVEEAEQKAASIMVHVFGLRVYGYHLHSKTQMLASLRLGLPWLPWPLHS